MSTVEDVNTFTRALLQGRLLGPAQQQEMFTTVRTVVKDPATGQEVPPSWGTGGAISGAITFSRAPVTGSTWSGPA